MNHNHSQNHYRRLAVMSVLSFVSMYVLMYAMVDSIDHVYHNFNQVYMAGVMTAPMVVIELSLMSSMFQNKRLNALIFVGAIVAGSAFFGLIRQQTVISDAQFLRSMIPHHSGAILMCQEASITDSRIHELCKGIVSSQQAEITQMTQILRERNGRQ
jgi:uncharacterized protein (DUF305 family)